MKSMMAVALCLFLVAPCFLSLTIKQEPVMDSMKDSFGESTLVPACSKIECGEYACPAPFELKVDGTCCGYCWAPDHVVAVNSTGFAVEQCEGAPSTCKGPGPEAVRCFKPTCRTGTAPHCAPGACCAMCVAE